MKITRSLAILSIVLTLGAGSQALASAFSQHSDSARYHLKSGDYIGAVIDMEPDITGPDRDKVSKLFGKDKAFKAQLIAQINAAAGNDVGVYERAIRAAELAAQLGLFSPEERDAGAQTVRASFTRDVLSGSLQAGIGASDAILSGVNTEPVNSRLLANSLKRLQGKKVTDQQFGRLAAFAKTREGSPALTKALTDGLPGMTFGRDALTGSVAAFDSAYAAKRLAESSVKVFFDLQSSDGLIRLDLKSALAASDEFLVVVPKPEDADVVVELREEALAMEKLDSDSRTIAYNQHQVIGLAWFLMPENSTYQFDYASGGYQYEYAYILKFIRAGVPGDEKAIRDAGKLTWSECRNWRIVNVFGGVQPVSSVANDSMKNMCVEAPRIDQSTVRAMIVQKLKAQIVAAGLVKPVGAAR